jgi:hypothetical protein
MAINFCDRNGWRKSGADTIYAAPKTVYAAPKTVYAAPKGAATVARPGQAPGGVTLKR